MILLDTHVLVWLDAGDSRLGKRALESIDTALGSGELYVSAISFWEVAMLVNKGRIDMTLEIDVWRGMLLDNGLVEVPMTGKIGIRSAALSGFHGDPADRMIVATAISTGAVLCTADEKILAWQQKLIRLDARR